MYCIYRSVCVCVCMHRFMPYAHKSVEDTRCLTVSLSTYSLEKESLTGAGSQQNPVTFCSRPSLVPVIETHDHTGFLYRF